MPSSDLVESDALTRRLETGRRAADRMLLDTALLLESLDDMILVFDVDDYVVLRSNLGATKLLGYQPETLVGRDVFDLVVEGEHAALQAMLAAVRLGTAGEVWRITTSMLGADGRVVAVTGGLRILHFASADRPVFAAILRRPTPRDLSERRIAAERERANELLSKLHDGVIECSVTEQRHLYCNPRFAEMVGFTVDEVLSASWPGPWWEASTAAELVRCAAGLTAGVVTGDDTGDDMDVSLIRSNGERLPVRLHLSLVENGESTKMVALVHDRTAELHHEAALEEVHASLAVARDRERIGRNLHDNAIQRLFATGLNLQSALGRDGLDIRVGEAIDEIDEIIREIRATIFTLHTPRTMLEGLEWTVRSTVAESARVLGHQPTITIEGELDLVDADLGYEVLSVLRELVTNVAKHAKATASWVTLCVDGSTLELTVADDGVGYRHEPGRAGLGLGNLVERAVARGGSASISKRNPWGTVVRWQVPLALETWR
ncbi:MAG: PAS domain S-box protein [Actinomycetota bacterium]